MAPIHVKNNVPAPRKSSEPRIAEAIAPAEQAAPLAVVSTPPKPARPAKTPTPEPDDFEKMSISIEPEVAQALREAAVITHRVSASALVQVALLRFLALSKTEQTGALAGIGRRRKKE
jgi:hypothetical protein